MTPAQWARVFRAGRHAALHMNDPNPRLVMADALQGMAEEAERIAGEEAGQAAREAEEG